MLMSYHIQDYIAWMILVSVVIVFVILLCWNGYSEYKEMERLRSKKQRRSHE